MLSKEEYDNLPYKEKTIYNACLLKYKYNWSTVKMSNELKISRSTAFRWLREYLIYIDKDLYDRIQIQLKDKRRRQYQ